MNNRFPYIFLLLTLPLLSSAQTVAVVMSGGGAKGIAHVGVLMALEENGIPVDYVSGTSMGGIVGGAYAAGLSPEQIGDIMSSTEFQEYISGKINSHYRYYFNEPEPEPTWFKVNMALDSNFSTLLQTNLANDLNLNIALAELLVQASRRAGNNFDSLFVPYFNTAAEIFTQELIIQRDGYLQDAVRTTMSVPVFYRPIKVKGKYLFDGGIYDNFPVSKTQEIFNPDIIIGVNVSDKDFTEYPADQDEKLIGGALGYTLFMRADSFQVGESGIYIKPDLLGMGATDFAKASELIHQGYLAAMAKMPEIKRKIAARRTPAEVEIARREFLKDTISLRFNKIILKGMTKHQEHFVRDYFDIQKTKPGLEEIKRRYFQLVSFDYFKHVQANIRNGEDSTLFDFEIKANLRPSLDLGFGATLSTRGNNLIYLSLGYTALQKALTSLEVQLATSSFYKYAEGSIKAVLPSRPQTYLRPFIFYQSWNYLATDDLFQESEKLTPLMQNNYLVGLDIGVATSSTSKMELQAGFLRNEDNYSNDTNIPVDGVLDKLVFRGWRFTGRYSSRNVNRKQYASEGWEGEVSATLFTGKEQFSPGSTSVDTVGRTAFHSWFVGRAYWAQFFGENKFHLGIRAEGVYSNQPLYANFSGTAINSPTTYPMDDSKTYFLNKWRAPVFATAGVKLIYDITNDFDVRAEAHLFVPIQRIAESETKAQVPVKIWGIDRAYPAASAQVVYHSFLGPLAARLNYYSGEDSPFSFVLHLGFLIFRRRAME